jgi:hypothetical protein
MNKPDDFMTRLTEWMGRDLTEAEQQRAQAMRDDGRPLTIIGRALKAAAVAAAAITTPEHIMRKLRQRHELDADDTSRDAELNALLPLQKLRHIAAWEIGSPDWADHFITWAKQCGITIVDPRD